MKTTLDLPDDLFIAAKSVAARRRTTLKDLVAKSLRREIGLDQLEALAPDSPFEEGPLGILRLKKIDPAMTPEAYRAMIDRIEQEDDVRVFKTRPE